MKKLKNIDDIVTYCLKNFTEEQWTEFYSFLIELDKKNIHRSRIISKIEMIEKTR
jgi:N-glycosylase/DNA lyase